MWSKIPCVREARCGSLHIGESIEMTFDDIEQSDNVVKIVSLKKVDLSSVIMPTAAEYDLEEQLKAGVIPEQINVHGMLGDGSYNPSSDWLELQRIAEEQENKNNNNDGTINFNE